MVGQFRVEPAGLISASRGLGLVAGALGAVDLAGPLARAAGAVPGSSTTGQAGALGAELPSALQALRAAVREMSGSAQATAGNYTGADNGVAQGFTGLPLRRGSW